MATSLPTSGSSSFPFDPGVLLDELPTPAYLVGGWVRDRLLGRQSKYLDLDFVLPGNAVGVARAIARRYDAGFVVLDAERQIARVVFAGATVDFAQQVGNDIIADLHRRDFCMNAIALDCGQILRSAQGGASLDREDLRAAVLDPLDGRGDLEKRWVRMVAPENLLDDPLRVLRAYRQAAQLDFAIEPLTRQALKQCGQALATVAAERVLAELSYLLVLPTGSQGLLSAIADGILESWFPTPSLHPDRLRQIDAAIAGVCDCRPELSTFFAQQLAGDRPVLVTTKLAALVHAATVLESLGLSRHEQRFLLLLLRHLPQFQHYLNREESCSPVEQYQLFQHTLEIFPALAALAIAEGATFAQIAPWIERWCDPHDAIAHPPLLVTGDDLKRDLQLRPGPRIGKLLEAVRIAQVQGLVCDREAAIAYARSYGLS